MKKSRLLLITLALLLAPALSPAHHISMSVSDWKLEPDSATALFRLPLADAVWIMDPSLVIVSEAMVRIKVPVDRKLKTRVRDWISATIPEKVLIEGCTFNPGMEVWFEGVSVQAKAKLSCEPGYLDDLKIESHFLVDKNRLHTSLAALHLPDGVRQCLFRFGQFTCGAGKTQTDTRAAPARQARILPWWDYLALALAIGLLAGSARTAAYALVILVLGHALAPAALRLGLPVPSSATLRSALAAVPVLAGVCLVSARSKRMAKLLLILSFSLVFMLSWIEFLRLSVLMAIGLFLVGAGALKGADADKHNEDEAFGFQGAAVYLLALCFGLIHGFILLRGRGHLGDIETGPLIIALAGCVLAYPAGKLTRRYDFWVEAGVVLLIAGLAVFILRNMVLSLDTFEYRNAVDTLSGLMQEEISSSFMALILILALVIGGLHALTPGHGKTIVAAYLVGTKGRTLDAIVLGFIVTLTHTSSVIILALLALFASKYILPDQLVPWLTVASGGLILVLGVFLFQQRTRNYLRYGTVVPLPEFGGEPEESGHHHDHDHSHDHPHEHDHPHDHDHHSHDHEHAADKGGVRTIKHEHDGISHSHVIPAAPGVSLGSLIALGVTGGIVPCPDALAVLLIAVSLNRIMLGLLVIVTFSLGLAMVLIAIGLLVVWVRPIMDRFSGEGRFTALWLPLLSAVLITLLGAAMLYKAWP